MDLLQNLEQCRHNILACDDDDDEDCGLARDYIFDLFNLI